MDNEKEYLGYLIDQYQNLVFSICFKLTENYFDSEDLTQETFLSAYRNFTSFDGKNEKAWICRIATNKCIDYKRRSSNKQIPTEDTFFSQLLDERRKTEEECLETIVKEELLHSCKELKPPYNQIATAYFYHEMNVAQIAEHMNRNEKTVQTQIYRAKAMLRKIYGKERMNGSV